jgi:hypothetical protein
MAYKQILLSSAIALSLTACGGSSSSNDASGDSSITKDNAKIVEYLSMNQGKISGSVEVQTNDSVFNVDSDDLSAALSKSKETRTGYSTIKTNKSTYRPNERIRVTVSKMKGYSKDWVGIYASGASNAWGNVKRWAWTGGVKNGNIYLKGLSSGSYEARAFYNNSFHTVARARFRVSSNNGGGGGNVKASISPAQSSYKTNQSIRVRVSNMAGNARDWVGIYKSGSSNAWSNVVSWSWTGGIKNGYVGLNGVRTAGNYEARAFFNNSFNVAAKGNFRVTSAGNGGGGNNNHSVIYENAENSISNKWLVSAGGVAPRRISSGYNSRGSIKLTTNWITAQKNTAEYHLPLGAATNKILEVDVGGVGARGGHVLGIHASKQAGWMPHYSLGAKVTTKYGKRTLIWDSWFTHGKVKAFKADYGQGNVFMYYPSPIELVKGFGYDDYQRWTHFRVNLEAAVKQLEPGNSIISVNTFVATGGYLDNIKLSK